MESIDKPEGFEIIGDEDTWDEASKRIELEIEKHKNWAVFNDEDPLHARDSTRRRIEVFCEYFDVSYNEVLEHTQKFEHEMRMFDGMNEDIIKVKSHTYTERFKPEDISDPVLRAFAKRYEDRKTEAKAIDFLDMLIRSAYMLEKYPERLHEYRAKYRYVFVDEFQDISPVDFRLINLFRENLFAVGDDDQAIYGFRGGDSQIMQDKFGKQANVANYEITRNYRSTSSVVKHARSLILYNNPQRFSKNLRAENSAQSRVQVVKTTPDTIENTLLSELLPIATVCETHFKENTPYLRNLLLQELTIPQKIGILARNWYEVKKIRQILRNSELLTLGFKVDWSEANDAEKRKMFLRRGTKEIEVSTIHSAKGREWEKVILLVNTVKNRTGKLYVSLPDDRNDPTDERRLFYVATTRAKQELVILSGNCQFISEFQNVRPIEIVETIESQIKKELQEISQKAVETLKLKFKQELEKELTAVLKQSDELNCLRNAIAEAENTSERTETDLPKQLKASNEHLIERMIPVLDEFESQINSLPATTESNKVSDDFEVFTESVRLAHKQMLDSLKNYGIRPIETVGKIFNPTYHENVSPDIYSKEVKADRIAKEEQRGYLLQGQVVRKAQVAISKKKQQGDVFLSQDFAQPVRFVTYAGFHDLKNIETFKDGAKGLNSQGKEVQLQNLNVLFAFPREDMAALKSDIKIRQAIAKQNLQPIKWTSEKFHVTDDILNSLLVKQDTMESDDQDSTVQFITRSGHVLNGHLWDFDNDFLYMHINKKVVIVYRVGILDFKNLVWNKITKAYRNGMPINGHVVGQIKDGLRVKFQSLTGFLPASQVELLTVQQLDSHIDKTYEMMVIEINRSNNRFVLSRRTWLQEQKTKFLNSLSEISDESPKLRVIKSMNKTVAAMPMTKKLPVVPEARRVPLYRQTNLIVSEPVKDVIDTPTPIPKDFSEIRDTCVQGLKPETLEAVETERVPLYKPIDLIAPEPVKEAVDTRLPVLKGFSEIPNSQIQELTSETLEIEIGSKPQEVVNNNSQLTTREREDILKTHIQELTPETLETEIVPESLEIVNDNSQLTPQKYEQILKTHIQNLKPETPETENADNGTEEPTLKTEVDGKTLIDSTALTRSDSSNVIDSDAQQIKRSGFSDGEVEDVKKNLRYYLRQSGRFAVEKIKTMILRKPSS